MSFCPTKDLHSVYLDNELPEIYKAEYEAHIKSCPKCKKYLNELKALHNIFSTDSNEITPDTHYLDQSFDRLMVKMKYSQTTSKNEKQTKLSRVVYMIPAVAAAAAFAFVVPIGIKISKKITPKVASSIEVASVLMSNNSSNNNVSPNKEKSVIISGNIDKSVFNLENYGASTQSVSIKPNISNVAYANGLRFVHSAKKNPEYGVNEVEVFPPALYHNQTFSIKVAAPGMNAVSANSYVVPVSAMLGRY